MNQFAVAPSPQTPENDLLTKTAAGYQAWFHASDDLDHGWGHWSHQTAPEPGNVHPELFPDFREYPDEVMHTGRFDPYPDGRPVRFYQAHDAGTIDVHFRWMQQYGIDGVGVQRFYGTTDTAPQPEPSHLTAIRAAAERYGRVFYVMYDTSGCGHDGAKAIERFKADVQYNVEGKELIASPAYAHADGKPVICIWGLAGTEPGRYPNAQDALELVRWLKERGYFVIGGLPDNRWTEVTDEYAAVYAALDMASPWTPGRFRPETLRAWIGRHLKRDLAYCRAHGIRYQPVMFPGFAWSNFCDGGDPNATPRLAGQFLWDQARLYAEAGVRHAYFAMFDEYDEGTALAKAARDSFDLPRGAQYFQTLSADGVWLSSDFYLREAGAVTAMLRGERAIIDTPELPHSTGPVYWRNGFEQRAATLTLSRGQVRGSVWRDVDVGVPDGAVLDQEGVQLETAAIVRGQRGRLSYTGDNSFAFSGIAINNGVCEVHYRLAKTAIPVVDGLQLRYRLRAINEGGCRVGVDLVFSDGSRLSDHCAEVLADKSLATGRFSPNEWYAVEHTLPAALTGQTICAVTVAYTSPGEERFAAYLDDVVLEVPAE